MISNIGLSGFIVIFVAALLIFGPGKLPELGKSAGRALREFKDATKDILNDDKSKKE